MSQEIFFSSELCGLQIKHKISLNAKPSIQQVVISKKTTQKYIYIYIHTHT